MLQGKKTENSQNIVRPHRVLISVVLASVDQPSWIGAPLEIFKSTLFRGVAFQLSFISPLFLISYFVIKRRSANHAWRPSSKAVRSMWLCWIHHNLSPNNNGERQHSLKRSPGFHPLFKLSLIEVQGSGRIPWYEWRNVGGALVSTCVRASSRHEIRHLQTAGKYVVRIIVNLMLIHNVLAIWVFDSFF